MLALGACAAMIWLLLGTFPVNQSYEVVSIDGRLLPQFITANRRLVTKYRPTLLIAWTPFGETRAIGWSGCNSWNTHVQSLRSGQFVLGPGYYTALACAPAAMDNENAFKAALRKVTHWRRAGGELILEGDGASIRLRPRAADPFVDWRR
ncbi:MAG TPA: META domain-containing protein [Xanthobacteraceae bacterium]